MNRSSHGLDEFLERRKKGVQENYNHEAAHSRLVSGSVINSGFG
jgi:hypothetical protein